MKVWSRICRADSKKVKSRRDCADTLAPPSTLPVRKTSRKAHHPTTNTLMSPSLLYKFLTLYGSITMICIKFSIWSDIGGRVIKELGQLGCKKVIYIGKVGGLHKDMVPNITFPTNA